MDHPVPLEPSPCGDHPVVPLLEPSACTDHPVVPLLGPSPAERSVSPRAPLAEKAMSEAFARLRYRDVSLLLWQQQQASMQAAPPLSYLSRSQSALYSNYGNQPVVVRDRAAALGAGADRPGPGSGSSVCSLM